jgi:hypothetical protein
MKVCEELRIVHMFLREAALTPFKQKPNYSRFNELCMNVFHYVGVERALEQTRERLFQKVCRIAVGAVAAKIVIQCVQQLLLEGVLSHREIRMRS